MNTKDINNQSNSKSHNNSTKVINHGLASNCRLDDIKEEQYAAKHWKKIS